MGVMLDPKKLSATKELMPYIFSGIVLMIGVSVVVAWSLSERYGFSLVTCFFSNGSRRNCGNVPGWNEYGRRCFNHSYLPISTVIVFEYLRSFGNHYVF